jgi:hypothetical protein
VAPCPEFVQTALNLCVAERFRFAQIHFHTVFNRTVENFHAELIFFSTLGAGMVSKVRCRVFSISLEMITLRGPKKESCREARKLAARMCLRALAIRRRAAAKYRRPK